MNVLVSLGFILFVAFHQPLLDAWFRLMFAMAIAASFLTLAYPQEPLIGLGLMVAAAIVLLVRTVIGVRRGELRS